MGAGEDGENGSNQQMSVCWQKRPHSDHFKSHPAEKLAGRTWSGHGEILTMQMLNMHTAGSLMT